MQGFMTDCPDGRMNKEKMKEMFNAVAPSVSFTQKIEFAKTNMVSSDFGTRWW
jgi:hypothetical protein